MTTPSFQDHFSAGAGSYAAYRPRYPAALFQWVADTAPGHELAWDVGTGNGQAAAGLAAHFRRVIGSDASSNQVAHATPLPNVEYRVAPAERSGLADRSVDAVTVAQAAHWFDRPAFFAEVGRVARPGALLALWMYNLIVVDPAVDRLVARLYRDIVGPYWPGDRVLVDDEYRSIEIPFPELTPPRFEMTADWSGGHLLGYLRTWSASSRYLAARGEDPIALVADELMAAWGGPDRVRAVRWPLAVRAARVP